MPIRYRIYPKQRLVIATGHGAFTDQDVFTYQAKVWSDPAVAGFNELVDMGEVTKVVLPSHERVRQLADFAASMDPVGESSKMAIVAMDSLAYGLGQMYGARRDMNKRSTKQVQVFSTRREALAWLGVEEKELEAGSVG